MDEKKKKLMSPSRGKLFRACKSPCKTSNNNINVKSEKKECAKGSQDIHLKNGQQRELADDLLSNFPSIDRNFDIIKKVGEGTFSVVYLARLKANKHQKFALKHLVPTSSPSRIENELKCLQELGGKDNVLSVLATVRNQDHIVFLLPYFPHQKFSDVVRHMQPCDMQSYMWNLLLALRHVHKNEIIHRDVKPSNFLYSKETETYSLIDFGLAMPVPGSENSFLNDYTTSSRETRLLASRKASHHKNACRHPSDHVCSTCRNRPRQTAPRAGTPGFRSPEVLMRYPHQTTAVDMWAAGVILLCMLSRRYPFFKARDDMEALAQIVTLFGSKKMKRFADNIGKEFTCTNLDRRDTLKSLCVKLAQRVCPYHTQHAKSPARDFHSRKGKRKRLDDTRLPETKRTASIDSESDKPCLIAEERLITSAEYNGCCCVPDESYDLLERLLELNPHARISAADALKHPFVRHLSDTEKT